MKATGRPRRLSDAPIMPRGSGSSRDITNSPRQLRQIQSSAKLEKIFGNDYVGAPLSRSASESGDRSKAQQELEAVTGSKEILVDHFPASCNGKQGKVFLSEQYFAFSSTVDPDMKVL